MHKKALLALLLAVAMLMSGCALIEKDEAVDRATEIIRVGDYTHTKGEIQDTVNYQLNYMAWLYNQFGMSYDVTDAKNISDTTDSVIDSLVKSDVENMKVAELGVSQEQLESEVGEGEEKENGDYVPSSNRNTLTSPPVDPA